MFRALDLLSQLLAPPVCVFCAGAVDGGRICARCRADLPWLAPACPACAEPFAAAEARGVCCADCQQHPPPWVECSAPFAYAFPVSDALKALKFRQRLYFAPAFAELLLPVVRERCPEADALCPVPLHRLRHAARGFNQAREICRLLSRRTGLPVLRCIRRVRPTRPQAGLDRSARRQNLRQAFRLVKPLSARHVLIVDDVMTTGETCRQLAQVLLAAGCEKVSVLVVARATVRAQDPDGTNV